jgi:histone H3/H4
MGRTAHTLTAAASAGAANVVKKRASSKVAAAAAVAAAVTPKIKKQHRAVRPPPAPVKAKKPIKVREDSEAPPAKRKLVFEKQAAKAPASKKLAKAVVPVVKKKHRWHPGTVALRQIRKLQKSTFVLSQHAVFARLFRLALKYNYPHSNFRVQPRALHMAQHAFEAFANTMLRKAHAKVINDGKRITVDARDIASTLDIMNPKSIPDLGVYYKELKPILDNPKYKRGFVSASTVSTFADVKPKRDAARTAAAAAAAAIAV